MLYTFTDLAIWSTVENGLGLTASSIATLRPLFKGLFGSARPAALSRRGVQKPFPSNNIAAGLDACGRVQGLGPSPPRRAAFRGPRGDDGDSDSYDLVPLAPLKCSRQSSAIYEANKDVLEYHYYPVSAREARVRSHSDGLWHYNMGGEKGSSRESLLSYAHEHKHQARQGFNSHKRQLSV